APYKLKSSLRQERFCKLIVNWLWRLRWLIEAVTKIHARSNSLMRRWAAKNRSERVPLGWSVSRFSDSRNDWSSRIKNREVAGSPTMASSAGRVHLGLYRTAKSSTMWLLKRRGQEKLASSRGRRDP